MEYPIIKSMHATLMEVNSNECSYPQHMASFYDFEICFSPVLTVNFRIDKFKTYNEVIEKCKEEMILNIKLNDKD